VNAEVESGGNSQKVGVRRGRWETEGVRQVRRSKGLDDGVLFSYLSSLPLSSFIIIII
jgi:hypothetical protein